MARYLWCGDAAVTVEFGDEISPELHRQVRAFAQAVSDSPPAGLLDVVPTYRSATVHFDPMATEAGELEGALRQAEARAGSLELKPGRVHTLPVRYGGDDGPDLQEVADLHGMVLEQVVSLHAGREYLVYCIGFSPGFLFLGGLPPELHTPRLGTPRKVVPAGSVGIGGEQTGVYPVATPGGWRLLGRTSFTLFDVGASPPCPVQSGDRVVFEPVEALPPGEVTRTEVGAEPAGEPVLEVLKPGLFSTVQDLGRWGYQASGVSVAGAMDPLAFRLANHLAGNEPGAAALEMTLLGPTLRALRPCRVALAGATFEAQLNGQAVASDLALELRTGDELAIGRATRGARGYLTIQGGIDVPPVLGSRSTYTRGGFGGLHGRALRAGDVLCRAGAARGDASLPSTALRASSAQQDKIPLPEGDEVTIRVMLGPQDGHFSAEVIDAFLSAPFPISGDADRMGYRLAGPPLRYAGPAEIVSDGVVLGSIQVPPHGNPIVMLADRASMGGYPKIATVISADVRLVAQSRPGMKLRFRQVSLAEARQALREGRAAAEDVTLPVDRVRSLLAAMQRVGATSAALEAAGFRVRLER